MKKRNLLLPAITAATTLLILAGCKTTQQTESSANTADTVFTGGKVYTVNEKQPWADAVAVKGNKIVYVGDAVGAKAFIGDDTKVIDTTGKMMLPGFISTHDHLIVSGWLNLGVQLYAGKSLDDYLKVIKEYADAHPDEKVIRGIGWNGENIPGGPTAAMLDRAVPDRPAIIMDYTVHDG